MTEPDEPSDETSSENKPPEGDAGSLDPPDDSLDGGLDDAIGAAFGAASFPANDSDDGNASAATEATGGFPSVPAAAYPDQVGPYKLVKKLGEGGMGTVWLAEQEKPVRRQVAIKLIKPGIADSQILARFEAERQALSMMDHPHIAKVLDVGSSEDGSPYFVMELVEGEPITEYCDAKKLSLKERLELFIQACEAVQHAHHKGIIHRDLKPSNILVHVRDEEYTVKVIDFGLAKALDQQAKLTDQTVHTEFGRVMGTLQYMSPEQAQLDSLDIDTRTDVYSLGIILYELLAGSTPIDKDSLHKKALLQVLEMVRDETPPLPSNRLSSSFDKLDSISAMRQIQSGKLQQILKGELDWVVMRALEKDRARRYATPIDFAADVRRYLDGDAVVARPPSVSYRLRKFVRKNWVPVGVVAGLFALVTGAAVVINSARTAAEESARRERVAATKSNAVAQLLKDSLSGVRPSVALGRDTTLLKEILERASERVDEELDDQPEVEAEMRAILSSTYWEIGEYELAEKHCRKSKELVDQMYVGDHSKKAVEQTELGVIFASAGKVESAEQQFRSSLAMFRRLDVETDDDAESDTLKRLATLLIGINPNEARELLEAAHEKELAFYGTEEHVAVGTVFTRLGNLERTVGDFDAARGHYERALEIHRKVLPPEHPFIQSGMSNLAGILSVLNESEEAEKLWRDSIELVRKVQGRHPNLATALENLGRHLSRAGHFEEAEELLTEAVSIAREYENASVLERILGNLSNHYSNSRRPERAIEIQKEILKSKLAREDGDLLAPYNNLAHSLMMTKRFEEAEAMFREAIALIKADSPASSNNKIIVMRNLGDCLTRAGRFEEAIDLLDQTIDMGKQLGGNTDLQISNSLERMAAVYREMKNYEKAEQSLREMDKLRSGVLGPHHIETTNGRVRLANVLRLRNKLEEAEKLLRETQDQYESTYGSLAARHRAIHGYTLGKLGRWEEAQVALQFALNAESSEGNLVLQGEFLTKVKIWLGLVLAKLKEFEQSEALLLAAEKAVSADDEPWDEVDAPPPAKALVRLYLRWHQAEPDAGHDAKADKWRTND